MLKRVAARFRQRSAAEAHVLRVLQRVRRLEVLAVRKLVRLQEVQQAPQLLDAVLQRRPRDEHLVAEVPLLQFLRRSMAHIRHQSQTLSSI